MEFDRKGPEGGMEIYTSIENGKAFLECKVYLRKTMAEGMIEGFKAPYLDIRMWDKEGRQIFGCCQPLEQEELAKGLILHPHLWQGVEDPYLYRVRVSLMERKDYATDVIEDTFAFRTFREIPRKGWFLNDSPFQIRAVAYVIPEPASMGCILDRGARGDRIRADLELIRKMGANTICPIAGEMDRSFCQICDEMGLLIWWQDKEKTSSVSEGGAKIPRFYGTENSLLTLRSRSLTERYYYYKACWSSEPFVYISTESLAFQPNGNAQVTVYSNQKKVALYVEGILFEFKTEGPDFRFEEIPVKKLPLMLAAEAGDCSMSVTIYPFT